MILLKLSILFLVLMTVGTILTLSLFRFNFAKFRKSELSVKIFFWIPIFIIFTFLVFANDLIKLLGLILISSVVVYEFLNVLNKASDKLFLFSYLICSIIALFHFSLLKLLPVNLINLLLVIGIASALSDVTAFFLGKYTGRHKLPAFINANKSWEGVIGQVVGALLGVVLIKLFLLNGAINLLLFIPIGIGSALGDVVNSAIKRRAQIKNWSNLIPGHGGFTDRLSSLSGSSVLTFYFLLLLS